MRDIFGLMEYLLDRSVQVVVSLAETAKKGEYEKLVENLRILQGDLMTMRQICAWARTRTEEKDLDELLRERADLLPALKGEGSP